MDSTKVLHVNQELFTIEKTGESGTSLRGMSRLSGLPQKTLSRWFESDLSHQGVPEPLRSLAGRPLYLSHEIKVRGKVIKAIRSDIVAEVLDFAAFDRGEPQARATLKASSNIGIESFIQGQTGYLPEKYSESTLEPRHRIQRLVKDANPWEQLYSAAVCDKVRRWYFPRDFFWRFAYSWMTQEERDFLNQFNPIEDSTSQRKNRIHQMLSEETRDRLEPEIDKICLLIETSTSRSDFEVRYGRVDGLNQLEIAYV